MKREYMELNKIHTKIKELTSQKNGMEDEKQTLCLLHEDASMVAEECK
jgi:hypothetical protein